MFYEVFMNGIFCRLDITRTLEGGFIDLTFNDEDRNPSHRVSATLFKDREERKKMGVRY